MFNTLHGKLDEYYYVASQLPAMSHADCRSHAVRSSESESSSSTYSDFNVHCKAAICRHILALCAYPVSKYLQLVRHVQQCLIHIGYASNVS